MESIASPSSRTPRFLLALLLALACSTAWARAPEVQAVRDALSNADAETAVALGDTAGRPAGSARGDPPAWRRLRRSSARR